MLCCCAAEVLGRVLMGLHALHSIGCSGWTRVYVTGRDQAQQRGSLDEGTARAVAVHGRGPGRNHDIALSI